MLKAFVILALIVATGYMLDLCFYGMNQASDLTYVSGILALFVWCFIVAKVLMFTFKRRKKTT